MSAVTHTNPLGPLTLDDYKLLLEAIEHEESCYIPNRDKNAAMMEAMVETHVASDVSKQRIVAYRQETREHMNAMTMLKAKLLMDQAGIAAVQEAERALGSEAP